MINQFGQFIPDYPGQQYYQDPAYMRYIGQHPQGQQPQRQQTRTVEVVPAESEKAAEEFPVAAGCTQMIIGNDDSFIAVKAVSMTGQVRFDIYDRRPPAQPEPQFNPAEYVRRDEIAALVAEAMKPKRKAKEETTDESV